MNKIRLSTMPQCSLFRRVGSASRRLLAGIWMLAALVLGAQAQRVTTAAKSQVWFVPGDDLEVGGKVGHPDYGRLFAPGSPWQTGYGRVDVFQVRPPWVLRTSKEEVTQAFTFFSQHKIKVAAVIGSVLTDDCGLGIEGFATPRQTEAYARAMKMMDLPLDYILVDEPVTWGHEYSGKNACQFSLEETAKRATQSVRLVQKYYPNAKLVLIEAPQALKGGPPELLEFLHDWKQELGDFPSVVRFDIQWRQNWQKDTPGFVTMLSAQHLPFGVIWDGSNPQAQNGQQWIESAKANQAAFRTLIKQNPSEDVIQTWSVQPERNLPESDPGSMTGYLKWFVTSHGTVEP